MANDGEEVNGAAGTVVAFVIVLGVSTADDAEEDTVGSIDVSVGVDACVEHAVAMRHAVANSGTTVI